MTCCLFKDALALVSNVKAPHMHDRKPMRQRAFETEFYSQDLDTERLTNFLTAR